MFKRGTTLTYGKIFESPDQDKPKAHKGGRVCRVASCNTTLSIYNSDRYCFLHQRKLSEVHAKKICGARDCRKLGRRITIGGEK